MKKSIALSVMAACFLAGATFAGEPVTSSKQVVAPPPPPAPTSYFRANEWSLGAFATYDKSFNRSRRAIGEHAWGGGLSLSYFPWLYAGFRIKGTVVSTHPNDDTAGDVSGDFILRYPLDLVSPNLHLAPYAYAGIGGVFPSNATLVGFVRNQIRNEGNDDARILGDFGGGLEYRFTPHIGIFGECGYNVVDGPKNNYLQTNFGVKFAF
jgi:Outer membrane protein beta-barrel domain